MSDYAYEILREERDALAARLAEAERRCNDLSARLSASEQRVTDAEVLLERAQPLATQKLGEQIYRFLHGAASNGPESRND